MDYSIIDELYDIYMNEELGYAEDVFINYYKNYELNGNKDLIDTINQYIKEQSQKISNCFVSNKDEDYKVEKIIKLTTFIFETLALQVHTFIIENIYEDSYIKKMNKMGYLVEHKELRPNDLFSINIDLIEKAIKENAPYFWDDFVDAKNLIKYVKDNNLLKELYADGSWHEMDFGDLIANLYDRAKDKSVFDVFSYQFPYDSASLFDIVKENCSKISNIDFDKYRAKLNSNKQLEVKYGKLIFLKNLLMFYNTGIMPMNDGLIDCTIDFSETLEMLDKFKALYSKNFDEMLFRNDQENFICNPEIITSGYKLEASRKVAFNNRLIVGHIVTGNCDLMGSNSYTIPYLIHINIEDVHNPCSNYEIQLNLLPHGQIVNRLQLIRFDNWTSEQPHKNVGTKLQTTSHIHIYNQFDLLRGKVNGNFDIAYNFKENSTEFEIAFNEFLNALNFDADIRSKIYNRTISAINKLKSKSKSVDI